MAPETPRSGASKGASRADTRSALTGGGWELGGRAGTFGFCKGPWPSPITCWAGVLAPALKLWYDFLMVYLVGAGPGDPGLITVKGLALLRRADVVVYDQLASPELLREAKAAELVYVGKKAGDHALPQGGINELLVTKARAGLTVVRLEGGDPFVFGRGGEEAEELASGGYSLRGGPRGDLAVAVPGLRRHPGDPPALHHPGDPYHRPRRPHQGHQHHTMGGPGAKPRHPGLPHGGEKSGGKLPAAGGRGAGAVAPAAVIQSGLPLPGARGVGDLGRHGEPGPGGRHQAARGAGGGWGGGTGRRLAWWGNRPLWGKTVVVTRRPLPGVPPGGPA